MSILFFLIISNAHLLLSRRNVINVCKLDLRVTNLEGGHPSYHHQYYSFEKDEMSMIVT